ncbi:hypothetical protein DFH06DRAFT_1128954 [Mycena polygramma]|nr:hypothetical protein DFH06DRAFT_1128954 [Mycena polygramma]
MWAHRTSSPPALRLARRLQVLIRGAYAQREDGLKGPRKRRGWEGMYGCAAPLVSHATVRGLDCRSLTSATSKRGNTKDTAPAVGAREAGVWCILHKVCAVMRKVLWDILGTQEMIGERHGASEVENVRIRREIEFTRNKMVLMTGSVSSRAPTRVWGSASRLCAITDRSTSRILEIQTVLSELVGKFVFSVPDEEKGAFRLRLATTLLPLDANGEKGAKLRVTRVV